MTIWQLLEQSAKQLDPPFRRTEIVGWFRRHHPEVNEPSLGSHIQFATAGVSRGAFASRPPLLERVGHGLYVRARGGQVVPRLHVQTSADAFGYERARV